MTRRASSTVCATECCDYRITTAKSEMPLFLLHDDTVEPRLEPCCGVLLGLQRIGRRHQDGQYNVSQLLVVQLSLLGILKLTTR